MKTKMADKISLRIIHSFTLLVLICGIVSYGDDSLYRCPQNFPRDKWLRVHGDKCYRFYTHEVSWNTARSTCAKTGGSLITITRRDIQLFVEGALRELWSNNGMWIGAHDIDDEMDWKWVTGERVSSTYSNWDKRQPSCFLPNFFCHEDCACLRLDEGYKWHDYLCGSDLYNYGFVCQYNLLPPTTTTEKTVPPSPLILTQQKTEAPTSTSSTTTSTTTTSTTTTATTTSTSAPKTTTGSWNSESNIKHSTETQRRVGTVESLHHKKEEEYIITTDVHAVNVESQSLSVEESHMETGGLIGMIISFILVFIAGLVLGILIFRRRYRKQYVNEGLVVGFNNVLYAPAPSNETPTKVKDTNLQAFYAADNSGDEETDHRYVDIDDIGASGKYVDMPVCKDCDEPVRVSCLKENVYDTVQSMEEVESDSELGGDDEVDPPPPCQGVNITQISPEFLKKETDVSLSYSNNMYGRHT